jgi:hypothetical protein
VAAAAAVEYIANCNLQLSWLVQQAAAVVAGDCSEKHAVEVAVCCRCRGMQPFKPVLPRLSPAICISLA